MNIEIPEAFVPRLRNVLEVAEFCGTDAIAGIDVELKKLRPPVDALEKERQKEEAELEAVRFLLGVLEPRVAKVDKVSAAKQVKSAPIEPASSWPVVQEVVPPAHPQTLSPPKPKVGPPPNPPPVAVAPAPLPKPIPAPPPKQAPEPEGSNLNATPLADEGIRIGRTLLEPFSANDLAARLDGLDNTKRSYNWLAAWKRKGWVETVGFGIYRRSATFGI